MLPGSNFYFPGFYFFNYYHVNEFDCEQRQHF